MDNIQTNTGDASNSQVDNANDQGVNDQQAQPNLGAVRKAGEQSVLGVLSKVSGQQFSNTRDAASFLESLLQQNSGGDAQPRQEAKPAKTNSELSELRSMIQGLQQELKSKDEAVRRTSVQSQIKDVAVKAGFDPNMLDIATNLFESQLAFDEQGSFYIKGANGEVKLDAQGNPYSLDLLAQDILKSRPKLAVDDARTGTGTKFGQGVGKNNNEIPDASQDLEGWKKWKEANGVGGRNLKSAMVTVNRPLI